LATALILSGAVLVVYAIYTSTFAEQIASNQQQKLAEVVPLDVSQTSSSELATGQIFAKLYVPRFGKDYVRNIAEGTSVSMVLNTIGIGHYPSTQMPGEVGNFAIAGHRAGNGGPMRNIDKLVTGDLAYVETTNKRYTYRFLQYKVVSPDALGVIKPVPEGLNGAVATASYLTMTTCTPIYINTERFIAWFELVGEAPIQ
jgi:sortase A